MSDEKVFLSFENWFKVQPNRVKANGTLGITLGNAVMAVMRKLGIYLESYILYISNF
jgi:hypothetical protein